MVKSLFDQTITNRLVDVYWNRTRKVYSIRDSQERLVIGYTETIMLRFCQLMVSQAGRRRVLETKQKNVHAWVRGVVCAHTRELAKFPFNDRLVYNPFEHESFIDTELKIPIYETTIVRCRIEGQKPVLEFHCGILDIMKAVDHDLC